MYACVCAGRCAHDCSCLRNPEEGVGSLSVEVIGSCKALVVD